MGHEDENRKAEEDLQDDLELSDQDVEHVIGGSTGNRVVSNPPPVLSGQMDVKP